MSRKAYRMKCCWGIESQECPNVLAPESFTKDDIEAVVADSGWPECLGAHLDREIKPLDQFSISVSGCPNGCSRPQIADFGLLQAKTPAVDAATCTGCGECAAACREGAIDVLDGQARIDPERCLSCGVCLRVCPEGALSPVDQGYRIQIGGKLGRHPRLADELPGIHSWQEVLRVLDRCLQIQRDTYRPGLRFGQIAARMPDLPQRLVQL